MSANEDSLFCIIEMNAILLLLLLQTLQPGPGHTCHSFIRLPTMPINFYVAS